MKMKQEYVWMKRVGKLCEICRDFNLTARGVVDAHTRYEGWQEPGQIALVVTE